MIYMYHFACEIGGLSVSTEHPALVKTGDNNGLGCECACVISLSEAVLVQFTRYGMPKEIR